MILLTLLEMMNKGDSISDKLLFLQNCFILIQISLNQYLAGKLEEQVLKTTETIILAKVLFEHIGAKLYFGTNTRLCRGRLRLNTLCDSSPSHVTPVDPSGDKSNWATFKQLHCLRVRCRNHSTIHQMEISLLHDCVLLATRRMGFIVIWVNWDFNSSTSDSRRK